MDNIFEVAKNMEVEGEEYYKKLADEIEIDELKGVFLFLADQERDHFKFFEYMQEDGTPSYKKVKDAITIVKEAFRKIAPGFKTPETLASAESAYTAAVNMEKNSVAYYTSILNTIDEDEQKQALQWIIEEEKKHQGIMETMVDFVNEPKTWLENAEFTHLDEFD